MARNLNFSAIICLVLVSVFVFRCEAFFQPSIISRCQPTRLTMIFGKKALEVSVKCDGKTFVSYEKSVNLRKELMANKVDIYPLKAKITGNCGGAGICGTCAVKVLAGKENMSPMSKNEINTLAGKPADWRLSCCARVTGPISIKTKP